MIVQPNDQGTRTVSIQAGAGLVADSVPENEYEETLTKARGVMDAIRCLES
jgi:anthranilate synthase component 1